MGGSQGNRLGLGADNMPTIHKRPPRPGEWLFRFFYAGEDCQERLGDCQELYNIQIQQKGKIRATLWYYLQIIRLLRSESELSLYWRFTMFRNYITIALRNLRRHKGYSFINIAGLTLGLSIFLLISVWVTHEFSYDRFHKNAASIYRINTQRHFPDYVTYSFRTPGPLSPLLKDTYPEIQEAARFAWTGERVVRYRDNAYYENFILTVDPAFLRLFDFPLIKGDKQTALEGLYSMVITSGTAEKYFGEEDPLGKVITLDNRYDFTITGVMRDVPANSHIQFDMMVPFEMVKKLGWATEVWDFSVASTYIRLPKNIDYREFEKKIAGIIKNYDKDTNMELFLQPLTRVHLFSNFDDSEGSGRILYVYIFSLVGLLILVMACINFMNLTTARSERRAKEIGMRKVIGASRKHLIRQFLTEAVFFALAALVLSPLLVQLLLPGFNDITGESFSLADFTQGHMLLIVTGITLLTGLISGSYPALYLSSFQPVRALQGGVTAGPRGSFFRKTLVLVQMSLSVLLIIVSAVIHSQIDFLKNKDLGFDKEHVVSIPLGISNKENTQIYERLKTELEPNPGIQMVSAAFTHPAQFGTNPDKVAFNGRHLNEITPLNMTSVYYDYIETLKIKILRGRSFSREFGLEKGNLIVNERFEKLMGVDSAVNQTLSIGDTYQGTIVGVMQDFHIESVSEALIGPLILFLNPGVNYIFVRVQPENIAAALDTMEKAWKKAAPHLPFNYNFLDEDFNRLYQDVEKVGGSLKYATIVAGFIACLGLLGLASFATEKRTKEIGIRKVLGSSATGIATLLSKDFVLLILKANLLAWPISWLLMRSWLSRFPYHMSLSWSFFVLSGLTALGATLLTVSFQTFKASLADPVKSLKYE